MTDQADMPDPAAPADAVAWQLRHAVLGCHVHALTHAQLVGLIERAIDASSRWRISHVNMHAASLAARQLAFRDALNQADILYMDGMPMVWIGRLSGHPIRREHRVTGIDLLPSLLARAHQRQWRVFVLGYQPERLPAIQAYVQSNHPDVRLETQHGYFPSSQSQAIVRRINDIRPHLLILGMGMPRQELWLAEHHARLRCDVSLCIGATFDYFIGAIPTPPRWMGRCGLEWLHRLASEPGRLAGRYLVEPWPLLLPIVREVVRHRLRRPR